MKVLGVTDENVGCTCCGRIDLKRYVVIQDDDGEVATYGSTCATKIMGRKIGKAPKVNGIDVKNVVAFKEAKIYNYYISRRYNFSTRLYEWSMNKGCWKEVKFVLKDLLEVYERMMEQINEGVDEIFPIEAICDAIDLFTEYIDPVGYKTKQELVKQILGI